MVTIYTDGACSGNPGPGGWSTIGRFPGECLVRVGGEIDTTNNRMELMGMIEAYSMALGWRQTHPNEKEKFEIYSDSAYVVNTIQKGWAVGWAQRLWKTTRGEDVKNSDLWSKWMELDKMAKRLKMDISVMKVKGHSGDTFNEFADKMAKEQSLRHKKAKAKARPRAKRSKPNGKANEGIDTDIRIDN